MGMGRGEMSWEGRGRERGERREGKTKREKDVRVELDLVHGGDDLRSLEQDLQAGASRSEVVRQVIHWDNALLHTEVADADCLDLAGLVHLLHVSPRLIESGMLVRLQSSRRPRLLCGRGGLRPVYEIQVDVVHPERFQRFG